MKLERVKYYEHTAGPDGWSEWSRPIQGNEDEPAEQFYKLACCDCGLVHDIDFRSTGQGMVFRIRRNTRATGQVRRHMR